jgi:hypothetical protein
MSTSVFDDKTQEPTQDDLDKVLGDTTILLKKIEENLINQFGEPTLEWKSYGKKADWTLAVAHKGGRAFHLIPQRDSSQQFLPWVSRRWQPAGRAVCQKKF